MSTEDQTKEYINNSMKKHKIVISQEQINAFIAKNMPGRTAEEIKTIIDKYALEQEAQIESLKGKLKPVQKENPYFGQVYKTYVIHVLKLYEEISNSNLPEEEKETKFESELESYLEEHMKMMLQYLKQQQPNNSNLKNIASTELHLGSKSLKYDTVGNLYNTFTNDVNIVSNDSEGKMFSTVLNNQKIFGEPIIDENGSVQINPNIQYNFDMIKEIYDFANAHGKQVKFHTFLWHGAIPEI